MALFRRSTKFIPPGNEDRTAIVGATGSGKSTFAFYLFAEYASFDRMPWIIVDYKGEKILAEIIRNKDAFVIPMDKPLPDRPGIYVIRPDPEEPEAIVSFLWKVYRAGRCGVFFDELTMVPNQNLVRDNPLRALLTQGRSKQIPLYLLTQRPVGVNVSVFSEATFIAQFELNRPEDVNRVQEYIPFNNPVFADKKPLPRYWSKWWDSKRRLALRLRPAPDAGVIVDRIADRVDRMRERRKV